MQTTAPNTIGYSSELMTNYLHASILDAADRFEVLQDANGNAILFSIGTDGVLYGTQEVPAMSNTNGAPGSAAGWQQHDLSTAQLHHDFSGTLPTCTTLAVNQNPLDATITLAMVVTQAGADTLYLCLGNSPSNTSWLAAPAWIACPFNGPAAASPDSPLHILNVFLNEAPDGQYVVVDVTADLLVQRWYITQAATKPQWNLHVLSIDLAAAQPYTSCLGRSARSSIDGIYTFGAVGNSPQFIYSPLWNTFGGGPPTVVLLTLPASGGGVNQPQAMAAFHNGATDGSTDLFACATNGNTTGDLYYFPARMAGSTVAGTLVLSHPAFINVDTLDATLNDGVVTVWGLNSAGNVFYTACQYDDILDAGAWSLPTPIASGIDAASPFINQLDGGNTIFAADGDGNLTILRKSVQTGMWQSAQLALPALDPAAKAISFTSYTTRIALTDVNNQPVASAPLQLSAGSRTAFYINNLYTYLDPTPVTLTTDAFGVITLIETVASLHGTQMSANEPGGSVVPINPMDAPFKRAAALDSQTSLQTATITASDGTTRLLVPSGALPSDVTVAATANGNLAKAYASLPATPPTLGTLGIPGTRRRMPVAAARVGAPLASISMDFGDLSRWIEAGAEAIVEVVHDAETGLYQFIANIAGQAYAALLDCVEHVVGAIVWVYHQIKTLIGDLVAFLAFLFAWKDILATHNVIKNILVLNITNAIANVGTLDTALATGFGNIQDQFDRWAGLDGYGQTTNQVTAISAPPQAVGSAPANVGSHHFQSNSGQATTTWTPPPPGSVLDKLGQMFIAEGDAVETLFKAIQTQIVEQMGTLSIEQIVQKFAVLIGDFLLQTAQNVLIEVVNVLEVLSGAVLALLTGPITIPVLSSLYMDVSGDKLTFLDVFCLISAIPVTVAYKAAAGVAPFPAGDALTGQLIAATSFTALQDLLNGVTVDEPPPSCATGPGALAVGLDPVGGTPLKKANFAFGIMSLIGAVAMGGLGAIRTVAQTDTTLAAMNGVANLLYISPDMSSALQHDTRWFSVLNNTFALIAGLKGLSLDIAATGLPIVGFVECGLNVAWNAPVIANILYAKDFPHHSDVDPYVIENSIGNFAFNVGGMLAPGSSDIYVVLAQCVLMGGYGSLMVWVGNAQK